MLPEWTAIGFSGHRSLENPAVVAESIRALLDRLSSSYGPIAAVSSAASGADTLFLEEIARRKLPFRLVLPLPRVIFERDFSTAAWQRVLPLLDQALSVQEITGTESNEEAYLEAGVQTVETADVMIFVWDGMPPAGAGGTADVVNYARAVNKPLIAIEPATGRIVIQERLDKLPAKAAPIGGDEKPRDAVEGHFNKLDKTSTHRAPLTRQLIVGIILLHLVASAIGIFTLKEHIEADSRATAQPEPFAVAKPPLNQPSKENRATAVCEFVLLLGALSLVLWHRYLHHKWIQTRVQAELCRSFLATWDLRRRASFLPTMTIRGCEKLARSLRIAWYLDRNAGRSLLEARDQYLTNRVQAQIKFFSHCLQRARWISRILTVVALLATGTAIVFAALALSSHERWEVHLFTVLMPMVSAGTFSVIVSQEHSRRGSLYEEMVAKLEDAATRLQAAQTWPSLFRVVMETENYLLEEVAEWHSFARFAGESHF